MRNAENAWQTVAAVSPRSWDRLAGGGDTALIPSPKLLISGEERLREGLVHSVCRLWITLPQRR